MKANQFYRSLLALVIHESDSVIIEQIKRSFKELYKMKDTYKQKKAGTRKSHQAREQVGFARLLFYACLEIIENMKHLIDVRL